MKSNTKDSIKVSFMKLLNQKPLSKITVKEIVSECGINRNSFYYHFKDIPNLLEEIFIEQADSILQPEHADNIYDYLTGTMHRLLRGRLRSLKRKQRRGARLLQKPSDGFCDRLAQLRQAV